MSHPCPVVVFTLQTGSDRIGSLECIRLEESPLSESTRTQEDNSRQNKEYQSALLELRVSIVCKCLLGVSVFLKVFTGL